MRKFTIISKAILITLALLTGLTLTSSALTFTAMVNGNWSGNLTWGGMSPGATINGGTVVIIPAGISVTLDQSVTMNGTLASIIVNGTLSGNASLKNISGDVSGSGTIIINELETGIAGTLTSTGTLSLGTFRNSQVLLTMDADMNISDELFLQQGTVVVSTAGSIDFASQTTINMAGGVFLMNGGSIIISGNYNLAYTGNAATIGSEASYAGLQNVMVDLSSSSNVIYLAGDLTVNGMLDLRKGTLDLSGFNLTLNGTVNTTANASVLSNLYSNITFNGTSSMGTIGFNSAGSIAGDINLNISNGGSIALTTGLSIAGTLTLGNGTIDIGNYNLNMTSGSGVTFGSASSYVFTSGSGTMNINVMSGSSTTFAVGTQINFAPVVVTNNSSSAGIFSVNAQSGILSSGTVGYDLSATQSTVNTSWNVETTISSGINIELEMFWNTSMEVNGFDNTQAYISHFTSGAWDAAAAAQATSHGGGLYSISRTGITSFSPFAVFDVNTITGMNEASAASASTVYPNPTTDIIRLDVYQNKFKKIKITDAFGKLVATFNIEKQITEVDVRNLAPGFYFITLDNSLIKRFVKS